MVGLCSPKTRERANVAILESISVLPAIVSLFMPAFMVRYGIIWCSLLVPAANSAKANFNKVVATAAESEAEGAKKKGEKGKTTTRVDQADDDNQVRWLKYWVVFAVASSFLRLISGILAWIPLSTHFVLLFWLSTSLPGLGVCTKVFNFIVNEGVGWGFFSKKGWEGSSNGKDTVVARGLRALSVATQERDKKEKKVNVVKISEEGGDSDSDKLDDKKNV